MSSFVSSHPAAMERGRRAAVRSAGGVVRACLSLNSITPISPKLPP